jgi:uncharacterized membrane protein YgaE (UPF0421/DUF939 family)
MAFKSRLLVVATVFLLAGCQTLGMGSSADVDPLLEKDKPTFLASKSGLQSCAIGAGVGALGALLFGGDATTIAVAAAAGCGVGAGADYLLDQRRAEFANNEQRMNSYISDIQTDKQNLQAYMVNVRQVVDKNKRQLAQIDLDIKTKSGDEKARAQELATMRANQASLQKTIEELDKRIAMYQDIADKESTIGVTSARMLQQLTQFETERNDLRLLVEKTYSASPAFVARV